MLRVSLLLVAALFVGTLGFTGHRSRRNPDCHECRHQYEASSRGCTDVKSYVQCLSSLNPDWCYFDHMDRMMLEAELSQYGCETNMTDTCQCQKQFATTYEMSGWGPGTCPSVLTYIACLDNSTMPGCDGTSSPTVLKHHAETYINSTCPTTTQCKTTFDGDFSSTVTDAGKCGSVTMYISCLGISRHEASGELFSLMTGNILENEIAAYMCPIPDTAECVKSFVTTAHGNTSGLCSAVDNYLQCLESASYPNIQGVKKEVFRDSALRIKEDRCSSSPGGTCSYTACGDPVSFTMATDCIAKGSYITCLETELGSCVTGSTSRAVLLTMHDAMQTAFGASCNTTGSSPGGTCSYTACGDPVSFTMATDCIAKGSYITCLETELGSCVTGSTSRAVLLTMHDAMQTAFGASCNTTGSSPNGTCSYTACGDPVSFTMATDCIAKGSYITCLETELGSCVTGSTSRAVLLTMHDAMQTAFGASCNTTDSSSKKTCDSTICGDPATTLMAAMSTPATTCTAVNTYITCLENELAKCTASSVDGVTLSTHITAAQTTYYATNCNSHTPSSKKPCDYTVCGDPAFAMANMTSLPVTAMCNTMSSYVTCLENELGQCDASSTIGTSLSTVITTVNTAYQSYCSSYSVVTAKPTMSSPGTLVTVPGNLDMSMLRAYIHDAKLEGKETVHDAQESLDAIEDIEKLIEG